MSVLLIMQKVGAASGIVEDIEFIPEIIANSPVFPWALKYSCRRPLDKVGIFVFDHAPEAVQAAALVNDQVSSVSKSGT